jgi:hypothetical protein
VSVTSPTVGQTVSGLVTVRVTASDNVGVTQVDYLLDDQPLAVYSPPVFSHTWDSRTATNGSHRLGVRAYDQAGNVGTAAVTVTAANEFTAPTVSLTAPAADSTVSGPTTVSASASDNVGVIGVQFTLDGANLGAERTTAPYSLSWDTTTAPDGPHTLAAVARDASGNTATAAAVTVTVSNPTPSPTPFRGTPFPVPGLIEAEDFDNGGEGVAYHDLVAGNAGRLYRTNTDVDIIANGTGFAVNNFQTGEWLAYTINVAQTGTYRIEAAVSSEFTTSRWHVEIDGVDVTGSVPVPPTGSWRTFQGTGKDGVSLTAGLHVLRIYADQEYFNLDQIRILAP